MKRTKPKPATDLRRRAEARWQAQRPGTSRPPPREADAQRLLQELQVHQYELELQNEQLVQTRAGLEFALERYIELCDFAPVGYLTLQSDGTIRQVNLTAANWLGIERARLLNRRFSRFVVAEDSSAGAALLTRAFQTKASEVGEVRLTRKGKPPLTVQLRAWVSGDGHECRVVLTDFTERKLAESALRSSEERHRTILQTAMDGFWRLDRQGRLLEVNEAYCRMSGYTEPELVALRIPDLEAVETSADTAAHLQRIVARGEDRFESWHRRKDGSRFAVDISVQYKAAEGGHLIAFLRDITERKRAEERMRMFSQEIIAAREEERKQVSSALHHDVGSLAVGISAHLEAIEADLRSGKPGKALQWIKRTRTLFDESVVRLKALAVQLRPPELDVLGLCAALRQYFSQLTQHGGTRIHFRETLGPRRVSGNTATILFRVAQEALTNAIEHGAAKRVDVELWALPGEVRLAVRDNGKGFNPSAQWARVTSQMGLRVMREMAAIAGGAFTIDSGRGKGTTVRVSLPLENIRL